MKLTKDTYLYLTGFVEDRDILNMLSVNKKFNDPDFFKKALETRYPLLLTFKTEQESWRNFYIRMIYYISKLNEEYNFPYIPSRKFNPEKFYKKVKNNKDPDTTIYDLGAKYAADSGRLDLVKFIIENGGGSEYITYIAAKKGYLDIVKYMDNNEKDLYGFDPSMAMIEALKAKQTEVINYFLKSGNVDFDWLLIYSNDKNIIEFAIRNGATNFDYAIDNALAGNNIKIADYLIQMRNNI